MTGHHCGAPLMGRFAASVVVFPVFVTGHHCGTGWTPGWMAALKVFPVFVTGHHCGDKVDEVLHKIATSSRSS